MRSTPTEIAAECWYKTRWIARSALNRPVEINVALRFSNCFQSDRTNPKSRSRVNLPGGRPNIFSRTKCRAVAPARKCERLKEFAVCATALSGSRTSGLSGLSSRKIRRDVLFIDQSCRFEVSRISCSHQIGIGEYWWDHISSPCNQSLVPKRVENLYVTIDICSETEFRHQLRRIMQGIYGQHFRFQIVCEAVRSHFSSPIGAERSQFSLLYPLAILCTESPRLEFGPEGRGVEGDPLS